VTRWNRLKKIQSMLSESKQVGLFPLRGSGVPCRTLYLVSLLAKARSNRGLQDQPHPGTTSVLKSCAVLADLERITGQL